MKSETYGKLWDRGDWNGFFGLFVNMLTNTLVLTSLLLFVVQMPKSIVFGRVLPGVGISYAVGNIFYAVLARRLSIREKRNNVTALPYGTGVEHIFIAVFIVMGPVYWRTGDATLAWQIGVAWGVIEGFIEIFGAFFAKTIKKITPRAAMLGSLSGLALTFIALKPALESWEVPYIGFLGVGIFLLGWIANKRLPWGVPPGFVMLLGGTIIAWLTGYMRPDVLMNSFSDVKFYMPILDIGAIFTGMKSIAPYLAVAIPLGLSNILGAVDNVESAEAAGDHYDIKKVMLIDGMGTLLGAAFGNPFPTTVYIGHPGWKQAGARTGYSWATGFGALFVCLFGLIPVLIALIPMPAILPILIYIGIVTGSQAFQVIPKSHAPAVMFAIIPWIANWGLSLVNSALSAAQSSAGNEGIIELLRDEGVVYNGLVSLGSGPIISSMIYAALVVFLIEHEFNKAVVVTLIGAVSAYFGLIHAESVGFGAASGEAIGYLIMALLFFGYSIYDKYVDGKNTVDA